MAKEVASIKERKLPERYPREHEIMVFGDMSELDYVLSRLDDLGKSLSGLPEWIACDEWQQAAADPLAGLVLSLRKAYIEYERFWQRDGWCLSEDLELADDLTSASGMSWRVTELEQGRLIDEPPRVAHSRFGPVKVPAKLVRSYDPAQASCAQSLCTALSLLNGPGSDEWLKLCIDGIRYQLTRYHAAALEILQYRNEAYLTSAHDDLQRAKPYIEIGQKIKSGGKKGSERAHGTDADKAASRVKWQGWVDDIAARHPGWSYEEIKRQVLKSHPNEVTASQLKRYTKKPRKK